MKIRKEEIKKHDGTLLTFLQKRGAYLEAPCNGRGTCGKCTVRFLEGAPQATERERKFLSEKEIRDGYRLACLVKSVEECRILLPDGGAEEIAVVESGLHGAAEEPSGVASRESAGQPSGVAFREDAGQPSGVASCQDAEQLSGVAFREDAGQPSGVTARQNAQPSEVTASRGTERGYGIAIDIGTTTLVAALVNLTSGSREASVAAVNHQRAYGADVILRIQAANEGAGRYLKAGICSDLKKMIRELTIKARILPAGIKKITIAGNVAMCHLLLGYPCQTLGSAPFVPFDITTWKGTYQEVFGSGELEAKVTVLPGISAFVGGDIVAGIYSLGIMERREACLFLDIGTNGEMAIGNRDGFLVTSTAAGPVFEGGGISCGMPGVPGAVSHVRIEKQDFKTADEIRFETETIGGKPPVGLCGTGIIDLMSELVRAGLVDENGTLAEPWFDTGIRVAGEKIRFTQGDIRKLQMGKAAIRAGIETLLMEAGQRGIGQEVRQVYLAGGFGYFMDLENAVTIGLLPEHIRGKITMTGNCAIEGAIKYLLDARAEEKTEWIAGHGEEISLAASGKFQEIYLDSMSFQTRIKCGADSRDA